MSGTGTLPQEVITRPRIMRAAVLAAPGVARLERVERPEPGRGEVLVRLEGCGVCASNLAPWEGAPWFDYPFPPGSPGHEGWGVVEAVGDGVDDVDVGDRVATLAQRAYAQYAVSAADAVVPIPDALADRPVPGEPLGCAMNILRRADIRSGQTVAVVGIGFLGALLVQLAARAGARAIALSRRGFSLDVAREMGAAEVLELDEPGALEARVAELTGGALCDSVIEATGAQGPLDVAARLTRERGRLVIAGYHQGRPRQVDMQLWNWRGLDVINAHERDPALYVRGMREAVEALDAGRLEPWRLFTHTFPLERLGEALDAARERPEGFLKALITT